MLYMKSGLCFVYFGAGMCSKPSERLTLTSTLLRVKAHRHWLNCPGSKINS